MNWKAYYKGQFYTMVTAESRYQAIDQVFFELQKKIHKVNRRDIVVIPSHKTWKKTTAQQELFR